MIVPMNKNKEAIIMYNLLINQVNKFKMQVHLCWVNMEIIQENTVLLMFLSWN